MRTYGITAILTASLLLACKSSTPSPSAQQTKAGTQAEAHHDHGEGDHEHAAQASDATEAPNPKELLAAEKAAYERAKPVFEIHCARCHTSSGDHKQKKKALPHFSMDSYPFGGHHMAEMPETIRDVLGQAGDEASMPADNPGAVEGEELALILAWVDAFERSHKAGLHSHEDHHDHGGHSH